MTSRQCTGNCGRGRFSVTTEDFAKAVSAILQICEQTRATFLCSAFMFDWYRVFIVKSTVFVLVPNDLLFQNTQNATFYMRTDVVPVTSWSATNSEADNISVFNVSWIYLNYLEIELSPFFPIS